MHVVNLLEQVLLPHQPLPQDPSNFLVEHKTRAAVGVVNDHDRTDRNDCVECEDCADRIGRSTAGIADDGSLVLLKTQEMIRDHTGIAARD